MIDVKRKATMNTLKESYIFLLVLLYLQMLSMHFFKFCFIPAIQLFFVPFNSVLLLFSLYISISFQFIPIHPFWFNYISFHSFNLSILFHSLPFFKHFQMLMGPVEYYPYHPTVQITAYKKAILWSLYFGQVLASIAYQAWSIFLGRKIYFCKALPKPQLIFTAHSLCNPVYIACAHSLCNPGKYKGVDVKINLLSDVVRPGLIEFKLISSNISDTFEKGGKSAIFLS